jgi:hypothetical protein
MIYRSSTACTTTYNQQNMCSEWDVINYYTKCKDRIWVRKEQYVRALTSYWRVVLNFAFLAMQNEILQIQSSTQSASYHWQVHPRREVQRRVKRLPIDICRRTDCHLDRIKKFEDKVVIYYQLCPQCDPTQKAVGSKPLQKK